MPTLGDTSSQRQSTDAAIVAADAGDSGGFGEGATEKDLNDLASDLANIGDKISKLTGLENCSGSEEAEIEMLGFFSPPSLSGLTGYNGEWDEDPRESQWRSGVWYQYASVTATNATSPYNSATAYLPTFDSADPPNAPHTVSAVATYDPDTFVGGETVAVTIARASGGPFDINVNVFVGGCSIGDRDWETVCGALGGSALSNVGK